VPLAMTLAFIFLGETPTPKILLGGALVTLGTLIIALA